MKRIRQVDSINNALRLNDERSKTMEGNGRAKTGKERGRRWMRLALMALAMLSVPAASVAGVFVSVSIAPPALPVFAQPICPGAGYIWTPGYWAYGPEGYYWVPGTWVLAPFTGGLWTPGYWGWGGGVYLWHPGYWGMHIGFYGGVSYGFGYFGRGYEGGYWHNGAFNYNRTVNNINITNIHNTYNKTIINNKTVNRISYNGGAGGTSARPTPVEIAAAHERHTPATAEQRHHEHAASTNRAQLASVNHGNPTVAASPKPGVLSGHGIAPSGHTVTPKTAYVTPRTNNSTPHGYKTAVPHPNTARPPATTHRSVPSTQYKSAPHPQSAPHSSHGGHGR